MYSSHAIDFYTDAAIDPVDVTTMTEGGTMIFMWLAGIGSVIFIGRQRRFRDS